MKTFACNKCGNIDLEIIPKGSQIGLYCSDCLAWQKWIPKKEVDITKLIIKKQKETKAD